MPRASVLMYAAATAVALTLPFAGPVVAAEPGGSLTINGTTYNDPRPGCYPSNAPNALVVNNTGVDAYVYADPHCRDLKELQVVAPGASGYVSGGQGVHII
ncbi:hypothetical protein [Streptomyces flavofungini]|uniref:Uncharacterized protein n=1 Tax=Streptomyces flavofungini TaxID=68200 RepID=A0ABS0XC30_9ACTN|nr:hypothetical protein [Streptomyces flavofungini]MBJ3810499.1 hypothetical protein [Streptomyces flavofungini]GHC41651.1 hypothetical protein GCM10010349_01930 [Streptomyces flavofungini]